MHNGLKNLFIFSLGVAAGVAASWKILKTKYEQVAQEEIDSVKDYYSKRKEVSESEPKTEEVVDKADTAEKYSDILTDEGYTNYSDTEKEVDHMATKNIEPRIIPPEEFDTLDDYEAISLTYYADGVLTDDYDEVVENPDDVVGPNFADHFGEYEDDSVFVRNDRLKADYEILYDTRKYSELDNDEGGFN